MCSVKELGMKKDFMFYILVIDIDLFQRDIAGSTTRLRDDDLDER